MVLEKTLESPLTVRRSNHSVLKEVSPECSLEGLMLKLKLQYFGKLLDRTERLNITEKSLLSVTKFINSSYIHLHYFGYINAHQREVIA